jgi:haloalkane dehalogenase
MPSTLSQTSSFYSQADVHKYKLDDASIAVRTYGNGPALILIHGYPVHGYTWNKILPGLASCYTCHVIDLPGFGDSEWSSTTDFTFTAQARRLNLLFKALELNDYSIIAHDTGATIARLAVVQQPQQVRKLVVINTEIPNPRPPWIPFYQLCAKLPLSAFTFKTLMKSRAVVRSSMGFKEFALTRCDLDVRIEQPERLLKHIFGVFGKSGEFDSVRVCPMPRSGEPSNIMLCSLTMRS